MDLRKKPFSTGHLVADVPEDAPADPRPEPAGGETRRAMKIGLPLAVLCCVSQVFAVLFGVSYYRTKGELEELQAMPAARPGAWRSAVRLAVERELLGGRELSREALAVTKDGSAPSGAAADGVTPLLLQSALDGSPQQSVRELADRLTGFCKAMSRAGFLLLREQAALAAFGAADRPLAPGPAYLRCRIELPANTPISLPPDRKWPQFDFAARQRTVRIGPEDRHVLAQLRFLRESANDVFVDVTVLLDRQTGRLAATMTTGSFPLDRQAWIGPSRLTGTFQYAELPAGESESPQAVETLFEKAPPAAGAAASGG